jgi:hypothetical protein
MNDDGGTIGTDIASAFVIATGAVMMVMVMPMPVGPTMSG